MLVQTRYFGELELGEDKIITIERGLFGFEQYTKYTILYDVEAGEQHTFSWLQSVECKELALPVVNPLTIMEDYNPIINDELLEGLGEITDDNLVVLLTMTVPPDLTKMTSNLKAPIIINADTRKGAQIVVENQDYDVHYNVYEALQTKNGGSTC